MASVELDPPAVIPAVRDEMVKTAIKFLENPKVRQTPLAKKQEFLQRKGLTDKEIQLACEQSGAYAQHDGNIQVTAPPLPPPSVYTPYNHLQLSLFDRIREIVHNVAIFSVVAYLIHKFYKDYIEPFLFGKKKKTVEETIKELDNTMKSSVDELKDNLACVRVEVDKISRNSEYTTARQLSDLKSDLATVKGLLLNRKQFPSVANSPVVPPSIPAWQMSSVQSENENDPDGDSKELMEMEMGSGSGSEPEHGTKTSESSLEIIYSSKDCDTESCNSRKSREDVDRDLDRD